MAKYPEPKWEGRKWTPYLPCDEAPNNEWLMWKHKKHAIYDAFPDGNEVNPGFIGLDFTEPIQSCRTMRAMCWRKHKKSKTWIICHYVAVQFEHELPDGTTAKFCTTFSRDVDHWMYTWAEWLALE